jgi:hypothetical protein
VSSSIIFDLVSADLSVSFLACACSSILYLVSHLPSRQSLPRRSGLQSAARLSLCSFFGASDVLTVWIDFSFALGFVRAGHRQQILLERRSLLVTHFLA